MSITVTGVVIIILGLYGFLANRKFLYDILIFFLPFSATAVINVGSGDSGSAVQPYMVLGSLWLLSLILFSPADKIKQLKINKAELSSLITLLLFSFICLVSLIMPIMIAGKEQGNLSGELNSSGPIIFSSRSITQFIYLFLGVVLAIAFYFYNRTEDNYRRTVKVYTWSVIFVMLWGWFELFCTYTGLTYPHLIFNNSISKFAGGFNGVLDGEDALKRISSVSVEPSILTQSVLLILPFYIFSIIQKKYNYSKSLDIVFVLAIIIFIMRSTSTIGIVTMFVSITLSFLLYFKKLSLKRKFLFFSVGIVTIPVFIGLVYLVFQNIINQVLFNKVDSYSGLERSSAILNAWDTFLTHPVLGVGWGSVTSFDLFVRLLSNTGILGCLAFLVYLITIIRNQSAAKNFYYNTSVIKPGVIVAFSGLIFSNMFSGFSYTFGFFWLVMGLAMVTGTNFYKKA